MPWHKLHSLYTNSLPVYWVDRRVTCAPVDHLPGNSGRCWQKSEQSKQSLASSHRGEWVEQRSATDGNGPCYASSGHHHYLLDRQSYKLLQSIGMSIGKWSCKGPRTLDVNVYYYIFHLILRVGLYSFLYLVKTTTVGKQRDWPYFPYNLTQQSRSLHCHPISSFSLIVIRTAVIDVPKSEVLLSE